MRANRAAKNGTATGSADRGNEGRYGEARYEDYGREHRGGGDEGWRDNRYSGSERVADYGNRGDWGRQGSWGAFGNRPDYNRENDWRQSRGMDPGRVESDFGGANSSRTNLYGTGGGGFGTGFASYGAGMGNFGPGNFGGGMSAYGERGRHSGRGPKGWQRSDERIREDVSERLADHPHIDASEIEVTVNNGEITLARDGRGPPLEAPGRRHRRVRLRRPRSAQSDQSAAGPAGATR